MSHKPLGFLIILSLNHKTIDHPVAQLLWVNRLCHTIGILQRVAWCLQFEDATYASIRSLLQRIADSAILCCYIVSRKILIAVVSCLKDAGTTGRLAIVNAVAIF